MPSVLQPWVEALSLMQQSVLVSSIRGCDGLHKDHISKSVLRWYRRCILVSAFDGKALVSPTQEGGGSFTGPLKAQTNKPPFVPGCDVYQYPHTETDQEVLARVFKDYFRALDEIPMHFHSHMFHAAQIVGVHHPIEWIRKSWYSFYEAAVNHMHLTPELPQEMNKRLGDSERNWKARETTSLDTAAK